MSAFGDPQAHWQNAPFEALLRRQKMCWPELAMSTTTGSTSVRAASFAAPFAGEPLDISLLEGRGELDGERVVASQRAAEWGHRTPGESRYDLTVSSH